MRDKFEDLRGIGGQEIHCTRELYRGIDKGLNPLSLVSPVAPETSLVCCLLKSLHCVDGRLACATNNRVNNSQEKTNYASNTSPLPDSSCYEALINVFVTLHRTDLIQTYLERLKKDHVHMTPYVANVVIKGLAGCGDMEGARALFETMEDPPSGWAANTKQSSVVDVVDPAEPVCREVSAAF